MLDQWHGVIIVWCEKIRYDICNIKSYTYDTNVEDIKLETNYWKLSIIRAPVTYFFPHIKDWNKV